MKFRESALAHKYFDSLKGIEIGGSAHNSFGLNTRNVDYSDSMDTVFKQAEIKMCGEAMPVDIVAYGDTLPLEDNSEDFVISSHVIEHLFDPIKAMKEWYRVVKPGGYIFTIAPITFHVPAENRSTTTLQELMERHTGIIQENDILKRISSKSLEDGVLGEEIINGILYDTKHGHWTVLDTSLFKEICEYLSFNVVELHEVDDKVGNGFTVVVKVE